MLDQEPELIEQAARRKQPGTYGMCANRGRPIEKARLEARPESIYCIERQRKLEHNEI